MTRAPTARCRKPIRPSPRRRLHQNLRRRRSPHRTPTLLRLRLKLSRRLPQRSVLAEPVAAAEAAPSEAAPSEPAADAAAPAAGAEAPATAAAAEPEMIEVWRPGRPLG